MQDWVYGWGWGKLQGVVTKTSAAKSGHCKVMNTLSGHCPAFHARTIQQAMLAQHICTLCFSLAASVCHDLTHDAPSLETL